MTLALEGRLVLIGAGRMGGALLEGWLGRGMAPERIVAVDPNPPAEIAEVIKKHGIAHHVALPPMDDAEVVVIAVKPQVLDQALPALVPLARAKPLFLSIAAGKPIAVFERHLGAAAAVIRAMPNTPAAVGRGISVICPNHNAAARQIALAEALLEAVGEVARIDEEALMDPVTAVSGSGPAYLFYLTECLAEAGVAAGLPEDLAMRLARATVAGSGELMRVSGTAAATLRQNVTSPRGTTFAALQVLMAEDGLQPLMTRAVAAAARRSRELAG